MRHFEQSLKAVADTGLPRDRRMEIVSQIDEYVFGYAEGEQGLAGDDFSEWEQKWGDYMVAVSDYLQRELDAGDFPHVEEFMDGQDFQTVIRRMISEYSEGERFDRGLERLLDGIAMEIEREGSGS
jgi:hypothetical protein